MDILFIPNLGKARKANEPMWGADIFAEAFKEHSKNYIHVEYDLKNVNDYGLVWVHNIPNLLKGIRGRLDVALLTMGRHPPMIGGVRGEVGYKAAKEYLRLFDAIHTSNEKLTGWTTEQNKNSYTLSSGVDLDLFAPINPPAGFCLGWAGDNSKSMKNMGIIHKLLEPTRYATKDNYIPYNLMPSKFYHRINALIHPSSHEGSCRVITEAAACGLPIICTDVGHNGTIVSPGWMFTLKDPIPQIKKRINLLRDYPELAIRTGMENRERVKQYSWDKVIEKADNIINQTLK